MRTRSMFARFLSVAVGSLALVGPMGAVALDGTKVLIDCSALGTSCDNLGFPPSPDSNGNYWNTVGMYSAPSSIANLLSMGNALSGWAVAVSGGGGDESCAIPASCVLPPAPFNIEQASGDCLISGYGRSAIVFAFTGLNSSKQYKFTLWGDRDCAAYGVTPHVPSNWQDGVVAVTKGTEVTRSNPVVLQNTLFTMTITPGTGADEGKITFSAGDPAPIGWFQLSVMSIEELGGDTSGTLINVR